MVREHVFSQQSFADKELFVSTESKVALIKSTGVQENSRSD
jgi:hypothetical protein